MSGHSKWSTIKRKKGAIDSKRSKIFSRIVKEIHIAVKEGGPIAEANPKLRLAIQNSKSVNMPKENVERAIKKADSEGANLAEITFEGYASHGIAVFIECLSDNNQRTVSNVRSIFTKKGGNMGTNGSLSFLFERKGVFTIPKGNLIIEELELELIDGGLEELEVDEENYIITTPFEEFGNMQKKLDELKITIVNAELERIPNDTKILDIEAAKKVLNMIEDFEDLDDVQYVYHNLEMTDELESSLG
ncbi:MAG: YebC/PmpR family DNA-binding transcriptional regulator [Bacteroidota bacterium]